jgi:hypothetical protein
LIFYKSFEKYVVFMMKKYEKSSVIGFKECIAAFPVCTWLPEYECVNTYLIPSCAYSDTADFYSGTATK